MKKNLTNKKTVTGTVPIILTMAAILGTLIEIAGHFLK